MSHTSSPSELPQASSLSAPKPNLRSLSNLKRRLSNRQKSTFFLLFASLAVAGCGGSGSPPPAQDFRLSLTPSSTNAVLGNVTPSVLLSVEPENGLTAAVSISLQGVPAGVVASPSSSFSLSAGVSQSISFSLSNSAPVGPTVITVAGTSGNLSHTTQLTLTAEALVRTYQSGSLLYLESGNATDVARIGLDTNWGGSIVEVSLNGTEFVNRHDTGREVQPSYRDGDNLNYNPTLGGDNFDQGTPTNSYAVNPDSLYITAQPLQWYPNDYGGGAGNPVPGDVLVEQTVSAVTSEPHTFLVHIKATHLGSDLHTNTGQEFPAVYTNRNYGRFIYYGGRTPWTNGAVTVAQLPDLGQSNPPYYAPERWAALVDSQNQGLAVYVPSVNPWIIGFAALDNTPPVGSGPTDNSTNYFAPLGNMTIAPGFVFEGDFYVIAGDYQVARQTIYRLHQNLTIPVIFTSFESTDQPTSGSVLRGTVPVTGWAFADVATVTKVEILVDSTSDGTATYGQSRPDVVGVYPESPVNVGFSYSLDTTKYPDGPHRIYVRVTDSAGNVAIEPSDPVTFSNATIPAPLRLATSASAQVGPGGPLFKIGEASIARIRGPATSRH